jgi:hypothetical protein
MNKEDLFGVSFKIRPESWYHSSGEEFSKIYFSYTCNVDDKIGRNFRIIRNNGAILAVYENMNGWNINIERFYK